MRLLVLFLCIAFLHLVTAKSGTCYDSNEECHSTNYQTYVECIRRRQKRSIDCDSGCDSGNCIDTCQECDCSSCSYNSCTSSCGSCCSSCCSNYVPCHTNHCCHKTCHAQCSTSSCRSNCRKNCFDIVKERTQVVVEPGETSESKSNTNINNLNKPNITTIIHLNNIINTTNLVDIPIILNNTNTQNITLFNEETGTSTTVQCCTVISPRECVTSPQPRCFHYRTKECGSFCTASIVHKEEQKLCSVNYPGATPTCSKQIYYIPQPQPKCTYQSVWPYVSCGIQKKETCQGCYSHYVNGGTPNYLTCPPQCYDDGIGAMGPLYRQGPVYRPGYSHVPCYQCLGYPNPNEYNGYPVAYGGAQPYLGEYQSVPYGGYQQAYAGYQQSYGGYPVPYGGYPASPYFPVSTEINGTIPIQVNDNLIDEGRIPRELEIEVNYEPPSDAQAEVKIKDDDESNLVVEEEKKEIVEES
ncbi:uncharacterized protein [Diabrotica undecimpunctata]|uniref:uncharacterized protein n=1 Tax=Diabrotica undecimpunctata TaxID=50387 RepID=UPI003B63FC5D